MLELISIAIACGGVAIAYFLFTGERRFVERLASSGIGQFFTTLWKNAWGFDWLYNAVFVVPFHTVITRTTRDLADYVVEGFIPAALNILRIPLVAAQNGQVRWYAAAMALGVVWLLAFVLLA